MLEQVARFASAWADDGALTGASPRISADKGDFQVVETDRGAYVLARQKSSNGQLVVPGDGRSCDRPADEDARYTVVPPALVELWGEVVRSEWMWPTAVGAADGRAAGDFVFLADSSAPTREATARCTSDDSCVMHVHGMTRRSRGNGSAAGADLLERYAPSP